MFSSALSCGAIGALNLGKPKYVFNWTNEYMISGILYIKSNKLEIFTGFKEDTTGKRILYGICYIVCRSCVYED